MNRTLMIMGVLAVLLLALLIVGCGADDAPATPVGATALPTLTPPAPTATDPPPPTPTAEPTTPPAAATPTPAPTAEAPMEADPSNAYFTLDRVLKIEIEIDPDDWDTLRRQTRTFDDLVAEIEKYQLSRPFASIYDWFPGTVTIDGETHAEVGVRKKGFLGSQSDTKPSLKLRYDKYVEGQSLGGAMERMTLNNSIQDPSMVNTCLAYQIFASAGLPSSRCSFATVTVNGKNLGLYVHVEEIKAPFLARHFDNAEGNLYEGTVSDFTAEYRGTFEKKTNEDADDWSDIDAVTAALQDTSPAGLEALSAIVDLDRFLTFWATETLVGHWDGYAGDRNNYHFYREPDGKFVFIPWGVDDVFHLKDDPNPFDDISNPPPSVLALTAIPNRLYNNPDWRAKYASRLKELLDTVWDEEDLLESVDQLAAIVQQHALPETRQAAAEDTERVRKFILKRRGEILADLTPEPPDWPEPAGESVGEFELEPFELKFETTWGSNQSANQLAEGKVFELNESGEWVPVAEGDAGATAGPPSPQEEADIGVENAAMITLMGLYPDGGLRGVTFWLPAERLSGGVSLVIGADAGVGGVVWEMPPGKSEPEGFIPITGGRIELTEAGTEPGAIISGHLYAGFGDAAPPAPEIEPLAFEMRFKTAWGSKENFNPFEEGELTYAAVTYPVVDIVDVNEVGSSRAIIAGPASEEEQGILPGVADAVSIAVFWLEPDGVIEGFTVVLPRSHLTGGATLVFGEDSIGGGIWSIPAGADAPDGLTPFTDGRLELIEAGTEPGAVISARFYGAILDAPLPDSNVAASDSVAANSFADAGLVINEVAAKGDPLDWLELYNATENPLPLANFVLADDLTDATKRVAFPPGLEIQPGEYLQFELDKGGWPGFALGSDEELGIWLLDGTLADMVDWDEGQSGEGQSYARMPDATGEFQTVGSPTPGAANQP